MIKKIRFALCCAAIFCSSTNYASSKSPGLLMLPDIKDELVECVALLRVRINQIKQEILNKKDEKGPFDQFEAFREENSLPPFEVLLKRAFYRKILDLI